MSGWLKDLVRAGKVDAAPAVPQADALPVPPVHAVPMAERLAAWRDGAPLALAPLETVHARIKGRPVAFCVNMADDPIQNAHRKGQFYEARELALLADHVPAGATILDIGANVGNHALWLAMFTGATRIIVIEPNPLALEPLVGNVLANRMAGIIDLSHLGFGLGDSDSDGWGMKKHNRNLGATKMFSGQGALTVRRGDAVFPQLNPDVIKIDVEGMEMAVLDGLHALIARARPVIMIEVLDIHAGAFADWAQARRYRIETLGKEPKLTNHLLVPLPQGAEDAARPLYD
jgi:FkbM family methyltransferase